MFEQLADIPGAELARRHALVRDFLSRTAPEAGGLLVFAKINIYYLAGTAAAGVFWLPMDGEPVLLVRKSLERAAIEGGIRQVIGFRSFSELPGLCAEAGAPMPARVAVDKAGITWQMAEMLAARIKGTAFDSGDMALALARSRKSEWELETMRVCGARHHRSLYDLLPEKLAPGMTERRISHAAWEVFFSQGHMGHMRMGAYGEEIFLGHVAAGDSGNYPSSFNGPLGLRGEHPATPFMGYAGKIWAKGEPLACDIGFSLDGYCTDKTQVYWAGPRSTLTDEVRAAHDFCIRVQARLAEAAKPGAVPSRLYAMCLDMAEKQGFAEGFMGLDGNKVPFVGHGIGLSIDGYPALAKGFDEPLEAGMVLALEPKQGIRGVGMVGVENTFEVTETGAECLTGNAYDIVCVE